MTKKSKHVIHGLNGGWNVIQSGSTRALRNFDSEQEAVRYGRGLAKRDNVALYIHRADGSVRAKTDYSGQQAMSRAS